MRTKQTTERKKTYGNQNAHFEWTIFIFVSHEIRIVWNVECNSIAASDMTIVECLMSSEETKALHLVFSPGQSHLLSNTIVSMRNNILQKMLRSGYCAANAPKAQSSLIFWHIVIEFVVWNRSNRYKSDIIIIRKWLAFSRSSFLNVPIEFNGVKRIKNERIATANYVRTAVRAEAFKKRLAIINALCKNEVSRYLQRARAFE